MLESRSIGRCLYPISNQSDASQKINPLISSQMMIPLFQNLNFDPSLGGDEPMGDTRTQNVTHKEDNKCDHHLSRHKSEI